MIFSYLTQKELVRPNLEPEQGEDCLQSVLNLEVRRLKYYHPPPQNQFILMLKRKQ